MPLFCEIVWVKRTIKAYGCELIEGKNAGFCCASFIYSVRDFIS